MKTRAFMITIPEWSRYPLTASLIQELISDDSFKLKPGMIKVREITCETILIPTPERRDDAHTTDTESRR